MRGRLYLQTLMPTGMFRIFRPATGGQVADITVPGTAGNNWIVAARGSRLLISAQQSPCADSSTSLLWFNPVTRHEQMLIRPPHRLAGVVGAAPYGQRTAPFLFGFGCG